MKKRLFLPMLLGIIQGILGLGISFLIGTIVDICVGTKNGSIAVFSWVCLLYLVVYISVFYFYNRSKISSLSTLKLDLKNKIFDSSNKATSRQFFAVEQGEYITQYQQQIDLLDENYLTPVIVIVRNISMLLVIISYLVFNNPYALGIFVICFGLYKLLVAGLQKLINGLQAKLMDVYTGENSEAIIAVKAHDFANTYGKVDYFFNRYDKAQSDNEMLSFRLNFLYTVLDTIKNFLSVIIVPICLIVCIVFYDNDVKYLGMTLGVAQLITTMIDPISEVEIIWTKLKGGKEIKEKLFALLKKESGSVDEAKLASSIEKIVLENTSLGYEDVLVDSMNYTFEKGHVYAIVGDSGCGKSTFLKTLLKQIRPLSGRIMINDQDMAFINEESLFEGISYASQIPVLLEGSLKENIVLGNPFSEEKLENLYQIFPKLSLMEANKEKEFSQGEQKIVSLARTMYKEAVVNLFDEPDANLSDANVTAFEQAIKARKENGIFIIVTHALDRYSKDFFDDVITLN